MPAISALPAATTPQGAELVPLVQGGTTKQASITAITGGYGPNWMAASDAPAAVQNAVRRVGGVVCDGAGDQTDLNAALTTHRQVFLTEGTFNIAAPITPGQSRTLQGSGGTATVIKSATGLTGAAVSITADHVAIRDLRIDGTSGIVAHGIDANVTSNAGFLTGADGCTVVENVVMRNVTGDGLRMTGGFNRDSKIYNVHVWNALGRSFLLDCPDGTIHQCVSGTPSKTGFHIGPNASNWRGSNCKSWFSDEDNWWFEGVRHNFSCIEGQDGLGAGIRITGFFIEINGFTADSNGYDGSSSGAPTNSNLYSGVEVGRRFDRYETAWAASTAYTVGQIRRPTVHNGLVYDVTVAGTSGTTEPAWPTAVGGTVADGGVTWRERTQSGASDHITLVGGQAWDKNEASRGYRQRSGVRVRTGLRNSIIMGVHTGLSTGSHKNVTAGFEFDTPTDATHASNLVVSLNHGTRIGAIA